MCNEVHYSFSKLLPANFSLHPTFTLLHPGTAYPYPLPHYQCDYPAPISPGVNSHSRCKATGSVALAFFLIGKTKK